MPLDMWFHLMHEYMEYLQNLRTTPQFTHFQAANHLETLEGHYWHQKIYGKMLLDINFLDVGNVRFQKLPMTKNGEKWRWRICLFHLSNSPFRHWPPPPGQTEALWFYHLYQLSRSDFKMMKYMEST